MNKKWFSAVFAVQILLSWTSGASAATVDITAGGADTVIVAPGSRVELTIGFDFVSDGFDYMGGGLLGLGIIISYEPAELDFVDYIPNPAGMGFDGTFWSDENAVGDDPTDGEIRGPGFGNLNFITIEADAATLIFDVAPGFIGATVVSLSMDPSNPPVALDGSSNFIPLPILEFGSVTITSVPVPAAIWLMLSGLGIFASLRSRSL